jgi:hypothetical protein
MRWIRVWGGLLTLVTGGVSLPLAASSASIHSWDAWTAELKRQCPANHVDWVEDGGYDELLDDFGRSLPRGLNRKVSAIASPEMERGCGGTAGFSCEMGAYLDAFQRLRLIHRFAAFGCRHYRCEDIALCERTGLPPE